MQQIPSRSKNTLREFNVCLSLDINRWMFTVNECGFPLANLVKAVESYVINLTKNCPNALLYIKVIAHMADMDIAYSIWKGTINTSNKLDAALIGKIISVRLAEMEDDLQKSLNFRICPKQASLNSFIKYSIVQLTARMCPAATPLFVLFSDGIMSCDVCNDLALLQPSFTPMFLVLLKYASIYPPAVHRNVTLLSKFSELSGGMWYEIDFSNRRTLLLSSLADTGNSFQYRIPEYRALSSILGKKLLTDKNSDGSFVPYYLGILDGDIENYNSMKNLATGLSTVQFGMCGFVLTALKAHLKVLEELVNVPTEVLYLDCLNRPSIKKLKYVYKMDYSYWLKFGDVLADRNIAARASPLSKFNFPYEALMNKFKMEFGEKFQCMQVAPSKWLCVRSGFDLVPPVFAAVKPGQRSRSSSINSARVLPKHEESGPIPSECSGMGCRYWSDDMDQYVVFFIEFTPSTLNQRNSFVVSFKCLPTSKTVLFWDESVFLSWAASLQTIASLQTSKKKSIPPKTLNEIIKSDIEGVLFEHFKKQSVLRFKGIKRLVRDISPLYLILNKIKTDSVNSLHASNYIHNSSQAIEEKFMSSIPTAMRYSLIQNEMLSARTPTCVYYLNAQNEALKHMLLTQLCLSKLYSGMERWHWEDIRLYQGSRNDSESISFDRENNYFIFPRSGTLQFCSLCSSRPSGLPGETILACQIEFKHLDDGMSLEISVHYVWEHSCNEVLYDSLIWGRKEQDCFANIEGAVKSLMELDQGIFQLYSVLSRFPLSCGRPDSMYEFLSTHPSVGVLSVSSAEWEQLKKLSRRRTLLLPSFNTTEVAYNEVNALLWECFEDSMRKSFPITRMDVTGADDTLCCFPYGSCVVFVDIPRIKTNSNNKMCGGEKDGSESTCPESVQVLDVCHLMRLHVYILILPISLEKEKKKMDVENDAVAVYYPALLRSNLELLSGRLSKVNSGACDEEQSASMLRIANKSKVSAAINHLKAAVWQAHMVNYSKLVYASCLNSPLSKTMNDEDAFRGAPVSEIDMDLALKACNSYLSEFDITTMCRERNAMLLNDIANHIIVESLRSSFSGSLGLVMKEIPGGGTADGTYFVVKPLCTGADRDSFSPIQRDVIVNHGLDVVFAKFSLSYKISEEEILPQEYIELKASVADFAMGIFLLCEHANDYSEVILGVDLYHCSCNGGMRRVPSSDFNQNDLSVLSVMEEGPSPIGTIMTKINSVLQTFVATDTLYSLLGSSAFTAFQKKSSKNDLTDDGAVCLVQRPKKIFNNRRNYSHLNHSQQLTPAALVLVQHCLTQLDNVSIIRKSIDILFPPTLVVSKSGAGLQTNGVSNPGDKSKHLDDDNQSTEVPLGIFESNLRKLLDVDKIGDVYYTRGWNVTRYVNKPKKMDTSNSDKADTVSVVTWIPCWILVTINFTTKKQVFPSVIDPLTKKPWAADVITAECVVSLRGVRGDIVKVQEEIGSSIMNKLSEVCVMTNQEILLFDLHESRISNPLLMMLSPDLLPQWTNQPSGSTATGKNTVPAITENGEQLVSSDDVNVTPPPETPDDVAVLQPDDLLTTSTCSTTMSAVALGKSNRFDNFSPGCFVCEKQTEITLSLDECVALVYDNAVNTMRNTILQPLAVINGGGILFISRDSDGTIFYFKFGEPVSKQSNLSIIRISLYGVRCPNSLVCGQLKNMLQMKLIDLSARSVSNLLGRNAAVLSSYLAFLKRSAKSTQTVFQFELPRVVSDIYCFCVIAKQLFLHSQILNTISISDASTEKPGYYVNSAVSSGINGLHHVHKQLVRQKCVYEGSDHVEHTMPGKTDLGDSKPLPVEEDLVAEEHQHHIVQWSEFEFAFCYNIIAPLSASVANPSIAQSTAPSGDGDGNTTASGNVQMASSIPSTTTSQAALRSLYKAVGPGLALVEFDIKDTTRSGPQSYSLSNTQNLREYRYIGSEACFQADIKLLEAQGDLFTCGTIRDPMLVAKHQTDDSRNCTEEKSFSEYLLRLGIYPSMPMQIVVLADICSALFEQALTIYSMERLFQHFAIVHKTHSLISDSAAVELGLDSDAIGDKKSDIEKICIFTAWETNIIHSVLCSKFNSGASNSLVSSAVTSCFGDKEFPCILPVGMLDTVKSRILDLIQSSSVSIVGTLLKKSDSVHEYMTEASCYSFSEMQSRSKAEWCRENVGNNCLIFSDYVAEVNCMHGVKRTGTDNLRALSDWEDPANAPPPNTGSSNIARNVASSSSNLAAAASSAATAPTLTPLEAPFSIIMTKRHFFVEIQVLPSGLYLYWYNINYNVLPCLMDICKKIVTEIVVEQKNMEMQQLVALGFALPDIVPPAKGVNGKILFEQLNKLSWSCKIMHRLYSRCSKNEIAHSNSIGSESAAGDVDKSEALLLIPHHAWTAGMELKSVIFSLPTLESQDAFDEQDMISDAAYRTFLQYMLRVLAYAGVCGIDVVPVVAPECGRNILYYFILPIPQTVAVLTVEIALVAGVRVRLTYRIANLSDIFLSEGVDLSNILRYLESVSDEHFAHISKALLTYSQYQTTVDDIVQVFREAKGVSDAFDVPASSKLCASDTEVYLVGELLLQGKLYLQTSVHLVSICEFGECVAQHHEALVLEALGLLNSVCRTEYFRKYDKPKLGTLEKEEGNSSASDESAIQTPITEFGCTDERCLVIMREIADILPHAVEVVEENLVDIIQNPDVCDETAGISLSSIVGIMNERYGESVAGGYIQDAEKDVFQLIAIPTATTSAAESTSESVTDGAYEYLSMYGTFHFFIDRSEGHAADYDVYSYDVSLFPRDCNIFGMVVIIGHETDGRLATLVASNYRRNFFTNKSKTNSVDSGVLLVNDMKLCLTTSSLVDTVAKLRAKMNSEALLVNRTENETLPPMKLLDAGDVVLFCLKTELKLYFSDIASVYYGRRAWKLLREYHYNNIPVFEDIDLNVSDSQNKSILGGSIVSGISFKMLIDHSLVTKLPQFHFLAGTLTELFSGSNRIILYETLQKYFRFIGVRYCKDSDAFQYVIGSHLEFGMLIQIGTSCDKTSITLLEYCCMGNISSAKSSVAVLSKQQQVFIAYVRDALFRAIYDIDKTP